MITELVEAVRCAYDRHGTGRKKPFQFFIHHIVSFLQHATFSIEVLTLNMVFILLPLLRSCQEKTRYTPQDARFLLGLARNKHPVTSVRHRVSGTLHHVTGGVLPIDTCGGFLWLVYNIIRCKALFKMQIMVQKNCFILRG